MEPNYEKIEVFEVNENGKIIENYAIDAYEINDFIDEGKRLVQYGWQDKRLFTPIWDFQQKEWVEGLTEDEIQQREMEITEQAHRPSESELLKQENEMLRERLDTSENAIISLMDFL